MKRRAQRKIACQLILMPVEKPAKAPRERAGSAQAPRFYGVAISTLARLIEECEI